jgi:pimeloyl-ACP methyl ester carboxylesterase
MARAKALDDVRIHDGNDVLEGDLHVPENAAGLVIFAHGSGSSRFSSRNRTVAEYLERSGMATLLLDLLTTREEQVDVLTAEYRFDIPLLGRRVAVTVEWARQHEIVRGLPVGLFGASTGAAAALIAAAERPDAVRAVVSRGGRPDLAGSALPRVQAPTLLIVGGDDTPVIDMNEDAKRLMTRALTRLVIVPGASHLFEERGALEEVSRLASHWFGRYLRGTGDEVLDGVAPEKAL